MTKQNIQKKNIKSGRKTRAMAKKRKTVSWDFPLNKQNLYYLAVAIGVIILGYILMATGITDEPALPDGKWNNPMAVTIAPILLFIGYVILIPLGIYKYFKNSPDKKEAKEN